MANNAIEQLLSSEVLSEEVRSTLSEAWEAKLVEAREEITAELREEFANRYETDKEQMVEAMDAMLNDTIKSELEEFATDKSAAVASQVEYKKKIAEHAKLLDSFVMETLKSEISELREDRKLQEGNFEKLEDFVMEQLTSELNEFHQDKKDLIEQKVKLVAEGKTMIAEAKKEFINKASGKLASLVETTLSTELGTLKEVSQIDAARIIDEHKERKIALPSQIIATSKLRETTICLVAIGADLNALNQSIYSAKLQERLIWIVLKGTLDLSSEGGYILVSVTPSADAAYVGELLGMALYEEPNTFIITSKAV